MIVDPVPEGMVFRLKTVLPAVDDARIATGPVWDEAVKPMLARPFASVVAVPVVAPPVTVPAPEVNTL